MCSCRIWWAWVVVPQFPACERGKRSWSQPAAVVACVAVEVCSAAFYLDDDPGVLMSACLFGDGAAATIWRGTPGPRGLRCDSFSTLHQPENRDRIRFEMRGGKLRNLLDAAVPKLADRKSTRLNSSHLVI